MHPKKPPPPQTKPKRNLRKYFNTVIAAIGLSVAAQGISYAAADLSLPPESKAAEQMTVNERSTSAWASLESGRDYLRGTDAKAEKATLSNIFNRDMKETRSAWTSRDWKRVIDRHNRQMKRPGENRDLVVNWATSLDDLKDKPLFEQLCEVDRRVDNFLIYDSDENVYGKKDYFATPAESLKNGSGDCDDFAIMKYVSLYYLGVPDDDMRFTAVTMKWDKTAGHAVLVVNADDGNYVLDNRTPAGFVQKDEYHTWEYRTVSAMNASKVWRA